VLDAVLANGVAVRVLDLNDYIVGESKGEPEAAGHPSDNIPVALAVGAQRGRSGKEILEAIVMGYELYARVQSLMDRGGTWDGVSASALVTAAMTGKLMQLDETRLAHALALALARAATPRIVRTGEISATKSIANALVAQTGVQAALLAERGITGTACDVSMIRADCAICSRAGAWQVLPRPSLPMAPSCALTSRRIRASTQDRVPWPRP
jgi:2-methylcitrate dehydratase